MATRDCLPCSGRSGGKPKGQTSIAGAAAERPAPRYEVTRPDGTKDTYDSLVDALRERNRTRGSYRQLR